MSKMLPHLPLFHPIDLYKSLLRGLCFVQRGQLKSGASLLWPGPTPHNRSAHRARLATVRVALTPPYLCSIWLSLQWVSLEMSSCWEWQSHNTALQKWCVDALPLQQEQPRCCKRKNVSHHPWTKLSKVLPTHRLILFCHWSCIINCLFLGRSLSSLAIQYLETPMPIGYIPATE